MKTALITAVFLIAQIFAQTNTTTPSLDSVGRGALFIYYDFDSVDLTSKTVKDLSSSGHNGRIVGNVTLDNGKFGTAMTFHNELAGDQLVNAGDIDVTGSIFTVSSWVTVLPSYSNMSANMKIVSKKTTWDEMAGFELQYNPVEKTITFLSSGNDTGSATNVTLDSNWHHVAAVVNGTTVKIFVDGVDMTTDGNINEPVPNPGKEFLVGSSSLVAPAGGAWVGSIDEFRIYKLALTSGQIMWVMNGSDVATSNNETKPSPSTVPTAVPTASVAPSTVPTAVPSTSPLPTASPIVIPVNTGEQESSASGTAVASFIVVVSVFFCIFMM